VVALPKRNTASFRHRGSVHDGEWAYGYSCRAEPGERAPARCAGTAGRWIAWRLHVGCARPAAGRGSGRSFISPRAAARAKLRAFWEAVSRSGALAGNALFGFAEPGPFGGWNINWSPMAIALEAVGLVTSPNNNPFYQDALRPLLEQVLPPPNWRHSTRQKVRHPCSSRRRMYATSSA
jgi:hypothetical protein